MFNPKQKMYELNTRLDERLDYRMISLTAFKSYYLRARSRFKIFFLYLFSLLEVEILMKKIYLFSRASLADYPLSLPNTQIYSFCNGMCSSRLLILSQILKKFGDRHNTPRSYSNVGEFLPTLSFEYPLQHLLQKKIISDQERNI